MITLSLFGISFGNPLFLFLAVIAVGVFLFLNKRLIRRRKKALQLVIRSITIAVLLMVLASPYIVEEEEILQETTSILIIDDRTDSMVLFEPGLGSEIARSLGARTSGISKMNLMNLTTENYTALGDALYQGILSSSLKSNVVVIASDGRSNYGADPLDVAAFAAGTNTKISSIVPNQVSEEIYVQDISGSKKTPISTEYPMTAVIGNLGNQASYALTILIDGRNEFQSEFVQNSPIKEFPFKYVFDKKGAHNVTVQIIPESGDTFFENNVFNKVVDVIEKPVILFVTSSQSESPLKQVLEEVYEVDVESRLPASLEKYTTVVLDNVPIESIGQVDNLRRYLNDGGGLVVVGGNNSFGYGGYFESELENLLPVKSKEVPEGRGQQINVVILIDISGSTGGELGGDTKIDVEKAIAVKMIRDLSEYAHVGVAAFNSDSFLLQPIRQMHDTSLLEDKISRLKFGGGTYVMVGLKRARSMLEAPQGSKYVIIISDGITHYPIKALEEADSMVAEDIVIHSIGVGFDTDESFMRGLARHGNGIYFAPTESDRVKIIFGGLEDDEVDGGFAMIVTDAHHFITEGLETANVSIKEFNEVTAKQSAQVLAATPSMKPLLTVWRFGLGRVACLGVDNGQDWANQLYVAGTSRLISSTVNWAVGDPERMKDLRIDCIDTRVGEETSVIVTSREDYPQVFVDDEQVGLIRLDENDYYFSYLPEDVGFLAVDTPGYSCTMAVNYPEEYSEFGVDEGLLSAMSEITGGEIYESSGLDRLVDDISQYTVAEATGIVIEKKNMQLWFTLAAMLLFFVDIAVRRIREIRRQGQKAEEDKEVKKPAKTRRRRRNQK